MNRETVVDVPSQDDVSILLRILTSTLSQGDPRIGTKPTTAKALLDKNLTRGSVAMITHFRVSGFESTLIR